MLKISSLLFLLCFFLMGVSCQYDNLEDLYPPCDTTDTVTYSGFMAPLMQSSCGSTNISCHVTGSTGGSTVVLDSYFGLSSTDTALLLASVNHDAGAKPMPRNAPKLDACTLYKIEKWMKDGSPNN